jgi:hypothetical protein
LTRKGDIKWTFKLPGEQLSQITIDTDGRTYLLTTSSFSPLLEVLGSDGNLIWNLAIEGEPVITYNTGAPTIGANGTIYIVVGYHAYALTQGKILWKTDFEVAPVALSIGDNGTIYFGGIWVYSNDNQEPHLSPQGALNPNGSLKWLYQVDNWSSTYRSPTIGNDGTLYCLGARNDNPVAELRAINPNGTDKWALQVQYDENSTLTYSSTDPVVSGDGTIFIGCCSSFMAINPNGTVKWRYMLEGRPDSIIIGDDGIVYGVEAIHRQSPSQCCIFAFGPAAITTDQTSTTDWLWAIPTSVLIMGIAFFVAIRKRRPQ